MRVLVASLRRPYPTQSINALPDTVDKSEKQDQEIETQQNVKLLLYYMFCKVDGLITSVTALELINLEPSAEIWGHGPYTISS